MSAIRESMSHTAQVISSIAHDLRSPLNAVIGFSRLMLKGIDGQLSSNQIVDLEAIQINGQAMLQMIDNLIDLARAESGQLTLKEEQFCVQPLLDRACSTANAKGISARCRTNDPQEAIATSIKADQSLARKAVEKAMAAAAHLAAGGSILVTTQLTAGYVEIRYDCTASQGLAPGTPHILQGFRSHGASMEHHLDATGLNLLITQVLVELNGGTLNVEQASPARLTITIRLPADASSKR